MAVVAASLFCGALLNISLASRYLSDNKFNRQQYENSWYYVNCVRVLV